MSAITEQSQIEFTRDHSLAYSLFERRHDIDGINQTYIDNLDYIEEAARGTWETLENGGVHAIEIGRDMQELKPDHVLNIFAAAALVLYLHHDDSRVNLFNLCNPVNSEDQSSQISHGIETINQQNSLEVQQFSVVYTHGDPSKYIEVEEKTQAIVNSLSRLTSPKHKIAVIC